MSEMRDWTRLSWTQNRYRDHRGSGGWQTQISETDRWNLSITQKTGKEGRRTAQTGEMTGRGREGLGYEARDPHPSRDGGTETEGTCWSHPVGFTSQGLALLESPGPCPPYLYQGLQHITGTRVGREGHEER